MDYIRGDRRGSELVCFHVGTATTNAAGEYYMPAWRQKSPFSAKYERDIPVPQYPPSFRRSLQIRKRLDSLLWQSLRRSVYG